MKGFRLLFTLLIAMTFAFGTIACEKKEGEGEATTDEPAETSGTPAEEPAEEPEKPEEPEAPAEEAGTNGAAAEGGTNGEAPEAAPESQ